MIQSMMNKKETEFFEKIIEEYVNVIISVEFVEDPL